MIILLPLILSFILIIMSDNNVLTRYLLYIILIFLLSVSYGINIPLVYILLLLFYYNNNDSNSIYTLLFIISSLLIFYSNTLYSLFISLELLSFVLITYINFFSHNKYFNILYYLFSGIFTGIFILSVSYLYIGYSISYYLLVLVFLYKLGVGPFHILLPEIYNSISIVKVLYIDILYKYLIFFLFNRIIIDIHINLNIIIIITIVIGVLSILQTNNLINILIYSSIINYGYILIIIKDLSSLFIYINNYSLLIVVYLYLISYLYLYSTINNYYYKLLWLLLILNLIGIPPFMGFWIKLFILNKLILNNSYYLLVLVVISIILVSIVYIRILLNYYINTSSLNFNIINKSIYNTHIIASILNILIFPILLI